MLENKRLYLTIIMFLVLLSNFACGNRDEEKPTETDYRIGIILTSNTAIRIDPLLFSGKITQLNKGESLKIIDRSNKKSWISNSNDYWYKVKLKNGITGWTYGKNLKIISKNKNDSVDEFITEFWEDEAEKLKKDISGKWWSINKFGDFTYHCLEIYENNKYKSYHKGGKASAVEGEYNFDFIKNELIFLKGTTFKSNLNLIKRGQEYSLQKEFDDHELRFKKIAVEVSEEPDIETSDKKPQEDESQNQ